LHKNPLSRIQCSKGPQLQVQELRQAGSHLRVHFTRGYVRNQPRYNVPHRKLIDHDRERIDHVSDNVAIFSSSDST
jgi:hypothetical protein